jgi:protein-disulfide isomerase
LEATDESEQAPGEPEAGREGPAPSEPGPVNDESFGGQLIIAAVLVGLAIVMSALAVRVALDRNAALIAGSLGKTELVLKRTLRLAAAANRPARAGPDPSKQYSIETMGSPGRGPDAARVTVVEFGDFQCPFCARATPTLRKIQRTYGDEVRIVFKHYPLPIHPEAPAAHRAAESAHRQGKFWEFHDKAFAAQNEMSEEKYLEWADELGLDMEQFRADLNSGGVLARLLADAQEGRELELSSTPSFFVNGYLLQGAQPFEEFKTLIDRELGK